MRAALAALVLGAISGCASVPREAGFPDVAKLATERTGSRVHWNQGGPEDEAVAAHVRSVLAKTLTAETAVEVALLNNRKLQALYEELSVAQADLVQAGLLRNPTIHAEVRLPVSGGGSGLEFGLAQSFLDLLQIPLRKRLAGAAFEEAKLRVAAAVLAHATDTRVAVYRAQAAEQLREMRETVVAATQAGYELAKRLHAAGNSTDLDLAMERAAYEEARVDLAEAEADVLVARARLDALLGVFGGETGWKLAGRLPDPPAQEMDARGLEGRAIARSLDLGALRQETLAALGEQRFAQVFGLFPDLELAVHAEREPEGTWTVGPEVNVPIPIFDQGQARRAAADARVRQAQEAFAALAVEVRAAVRAARARMLGARERVVYYRKVLLPVRQEVVDQTQLQYNAMQVGVLQLLQARRQQVEAGGRYVDQLLEYWLARTELEQIVNGHLGEVEGARRRPKARPGNGERGGH